MMNKLNFVNFVSILFFVTLTLNFYSCDKNYTPEQKKYISEIEKYRSDKNDFMKNNPDSPFNEDPEAHFMPLKYYDVNPEFVFKSKLFLYTSNDTVNVSGTKGELRKIVRFGYLKFNYKNKNYRLNVYKGKTANGAEYYTIWFTDKTTGEETYGVGRYLDFDFNSDKDFIYTIDFNLAYNPYCAYSAKYSCAIPLKEDHLDFAVEAGEKKFHN